MSCEHPDRDVSYSETGDYEESKVAHCSACGYEWVVSRREWHELTGFDEGGMRRPYPYSVKTQPSNG